MSRCHPRTRDVLAPAYGSDVSASGGSKAAAIAVYTALRVALFAGMWLTIELLTPINGIWAIVLALLLSGAISIVVLDRQRDRVGRVAAGFFSGLNERIEASARAEDFDDYPDASSGVGASAGTETPTSDDASGSGEGEDGAKDQAVGQ